ncbi:Type 1 phosphatases regulator ypi1 [Penicillium angulare]|uniref:Type 1 phosphatases regulator ypi1 n=1 Tax=Penicillium angulare TaxID=116970 RepID=UPI0025409D68|nr:Type 1 phosphatases regulator ypi1 [Penicillium angulare]KAJ5281949.1 Type 1 phosphatases regulator ypi1 [Penicillium angulare]
MSQTRQPGNPHLQTITETSRDSSTVRLPTTLRLRGEETSNAPAEPSTSRRIRWSEDVVDNEGMGKKSSKVCCIYHKARPVGESSSESESSSSSDSDSDSDTGYDGARPSHNNKHNHNHNQNHSNSRGRRRGNEDSSDPSENQNADACCSQHQHGRSKPKRKPSPNAYEKMPKPSKNTSRVS